jgi:signal transduction histidine kinase/DNA-binding response OmpR family regulator
MGLFEKKCLAHLRSVVFGHSVTFGGFLSHKLVQKTVSVLYPAMRFPRVLCCVLLLTFAFAEAKAQQYRAFARRYGIEEGLPHRQVNKIIQDRNGFIWAATNAGVARFDGRHFKVFNKTENGLGSDLVEWVAEDADGYIWACRSGPNGWLCMLDPLSGNVIPADTFFQKRPLPVPTSNFWKAPVSMADGSLVQGLLNPGGLLWHHPKNGWTHIKLPKSNGFFPLKTGRQQSVWGLRVPADTSPVALVEIDLSGKILQQINPQPGWTFSERRGDSGSPDHFFLMEHKPGEKPVLWKVDTAGNRTATTCPIENPFAYQYSQLENDQIEVQFPLVLERNGKVLLDISHQYPELDVLQFRDYLVGRNGNIWFATTFGLIVVDIHQTYFRRLLYDEQAPGGRGKACRGLLEQNGNLLVNLEAVGQGRYRVDPHTGQAERLQGDCAIGIAKSADGNVWTECITGPNSWQTLSLFKSAPDGQLIRQHLLQKKDFGYIWSIVEDNPQRVLLGHIHGATIYNPADGTAKPWKDEHFPEFDRANISWLGKDRSGQIWACTEQGLFNLKPGGGVAGRYWSGGAGAHFLPYDFIYHFYEDQDGVFWLGTSGGGLIRWDRKAPAGRHTQVIFRKNGLLNGFVYAAYEDRHQHLWLPTDYGIVQLDKKSLQVRHTWLTADGLTHNEFNRTSHFMGADGTLYFGGLNGVTAFHPDDFYTKTTEGKSTTPLVVSAFSVLDAGTGQLENRLAEIVRQNHFTMYPDDRYIQLEFALLDYFAAEKVTYTWKLEGISADWESIREPELRLSSLPYGTHRLRIRAQASDGTWAANELNIELTVLPPVYLRGWFLLLVALSLAAGIRGWVYWRTREHRFEQERLEAEVDRQTATIRHQTEELKKLDQAKSRFFANVSHELRTPLTLMLGPLSSMLKGNRLESRDFTYAKTAHEHGKQLLQLVNEILDLSKLESGKMQLQETTVSLQPFLRRIVSAFESHAERLGILFVFEYQLSERLRVQVDEDKLQKVLNNLLSNALKFTPPHSGGAVRVTVSDANGNIRIGVHDTGRGIHPDDLPYVFERFYQTSRPDTPIEGGTGIGLALCREFSELLKGRITAESTLGQGSSFYFEFPKKEVLGVGNDELLMMNDDRDTTQDSSFIIHHSSLINHSSLRKTVLLVEDNDSLRDYVQSILSEKYHVVTAENGKVALDMLSLTLQPSNEKPSNSFQPDSSFIIHHSSLKLPHLIISDIMMPVMDGFQLLENLKADDRWRHIPVVMLTARADLRDKLRALRIGVDDYILKPFEEEELLARVENLLKNYDARSPTLQPETLQPETFQPETFQPATFSLEDLAWLEAFEQVVEKRLGDSNLTAEMLADALAMSRASFFRQLKRLTGLTPAQYLDEARFQTARRLLESREVSSVKAAAYSVGFRQVKHFSQNYKKRFGKLPSE